MSTETERMVHTEDPVTKALGSLVDAGWSNRVHRVDGPDTESPWTVAAIDLTTERETMKGLVDVLPEPGWWVIWDAAGEEYAVSYETSSEAAWAFTGVTEREEYPDGFEVGQEPRVRVCGAITGKGEVCGRPAKRKARFNAPLCGIHVRAAEARGEDTWPLD